MGNADWGSASESNTLVYLLPINNDYKKDPPMGVSGSWEWLLYRLYLRSDDLTAIPTKREGRSPPVFSRTESCCCPICPVDLDSGLEPIENSGTVQLLGLWLFYRPRIIFSHVWGGFGGMEIDLRSLHSGAVWDLCRTRVRVRVMGFRGSKGCRLPRNFPPL